MTPLVHNLEYDLVLFDRYNSIFDVIRIKEKIVSPYSRTLTLPDRTSYVSLRLRKVNKTAFTVRPIAQVAGGNIFLYILGALVLSLMESVAIMVGCAYAFGGVFREDFSRSASDMLLGLAIAALAVLIGMIMTAQSVRRRAKV